MHHVKNVSDNKVPKQIQKMTQTLITTIKPAAPDDGIRDSIYGSAKTWELTTVSILYDHYNIVIERELSEIKLNIDEHWKEQFRVTANWARQDLGRCLLPETVGEAEDLIANSVGDAASTGHGTTPAPSRREEGSTGGREHRAVTPPPPASPSPIRPPSMQQQTTHAQVHQSTMYSRPMQLIPAADAARQRPDKDWTIPPRQQQSPTGEQREDYVADNRAEPRFWRLAVRFQLGQPGINLCFSGATEEYNYFHTIEITIWDWDEHRNNEGPSMATMCCRGGAGDWTIDRLGPECGRSLVRDRLGDPVTGDSFA